MFSVFCQIFISIRCRYFLYCTDRSQTPLQEEMLLWGKEYLLNELDQGNIEFFTGGSGGKRCTKPFLTFLYVYSLEHFFPVFIHSLPAVIAFKLVVPIYLKEYTGEIREYYWGHESISMTRSINVTSFSSVPCWSYSDYWSQKLTQSGNIHFIIKINCLTLFHFSVSLYGVQERCPP